MNAKSVLLMVPAAVVGVGLGAVAGYTIARRTTAAQRTDERESLLIHEGYARQARAHLRWLRATEDKPAERQSRLRTEGLVTLQIYVREVDDLRAQFGAGWVGIDEDLYAAAKAYLAKHPGPPGNG